MKNRSNQPILKLLFQDGGYFLEGIPIKVVGERECVGERFLTIQRIGSNKKYDFMLKGWGKRRKLNSEKGLNGIILKKWYGGRI